MQFLENAPRFLFFTGKGGVGKTSIACATALQLTAQGRRVLLVSTDPASNVGQVFGISIGNHITPVPSVANLSALEIDPQAAAQAYRDRIVGPARGVLEASVVKNMEEQLSGACTTEIAAFDEFTALLVGSRQTDTYEHIIFDTAPTGHTIRLLQLPGAWSGFLDAGKGDASCLGPLAGLDKQHDQYRKAVEALCDRARTRLVLYLVVNGVLPGSEAEKDPLAAAVYAREQLALAQMPDVLKPLPLDQLPLKAFDLVGIEALKQLLRDKGDAEGLQPPAVRIDAPSLSDLVDDIAADGHGLVMIMGKGGVGKTTLAAAVAVELAHRGLPVHLTTSDPAAHLADTLSGSMSNLTLSRIDPKVETQRYRDHVMATKGAALDEQGKALLAEDLRSPCTEEIAVFQAFSRVIREAGRRFVVMDTAPTGHTLLLLDATGAYHRDIARQMEGSNMHFSTPMMQLQDPKKTKVLLVTLAETTPVLEAANLQADLRRAGIEPWAWVINNSIAATTTQSPLLRRRAKNELREIEHVASEHARRYAVIPLMAEEPIGVERLLKLSKKQPRDW